MCSFQSFSPAPFPLHVDQPHIKGNFLIGFGMGWIFLCWVWCLTGRLAASPPSLHNVCGRPPWNWGWGQVVRQRGNGFYFESIVWRRGKGWRGKLWPAPHPQASQPLLFTNLNSYSLDFPWERDSKLLGPSSELQISPGCATTRAATYPAGWGKSQLSKVGYSGDSLLWVSHCVNGKADFCSILHHISVTLWFSLPDTSPCNSGLQHSNVMCFLCTVFCGVHVTKAHFLWHPHPLTFCGLYLTPLEKH